MADEARFLTGPREADTDAPGLVLNDDGSVSIVEPGGSRAALQSDGGPGSQPIYAANNLPISSAQFLDLGSTPVELVAAPGPGKVIVPLPYATILFRPGPNTYTDGGSAFQISQLDPGLHAEQWFTMQSGIIQTSQVDGDQFGFFDAMLALGSSGWNALDLYENLPLGLVGNDFSDGDGTALIYFQYALIDV